MARGRGSTPTAPALVGALTPVHGAARVLRRTMGRAACVARDRRLARELAPLALPFVLAPWLYYCVKHYAAASAFRDTTLLVYASWCMMHGERIYRTIAMMDGPLAFLTHALLLLWGGVNEQAWRHVDLWFHVLAGGAIGALLAPPAARYAAVRKATWATVGASLWVTEVVAFDFQATLQREAHYAGLGMLGMALVYAAANRPRRVAAAMVFAGTFIAGSTAWGKQTAAIYALFAVVTALLLPPAPGRSRWGRVRWALLGGIAVSLLMLAFVAATGSLRGMWFWFFRYNIDYYRFHEIIPLADILSRGYARDAFALQGISLVGGLSAIAVGALPPRAIGFALVPTLELASVVMQHRGWPYHFIPVDLGGAVFLVLAMAHAWGAKGNGHRGAAQNTAAVALTAFVAWTAGQAVSASPWMHASEEHKSDPLVTDPQKAGAVLAAHTKSDDRVFHFGDDPGILLFAKRRPATQYIVPWMVDLLHHVPLTGPLRVPAKAQRRIRDLEALNEHDDCTQVMDNPPAALVFRDYSVAYGDNIASVFYRFCPAFEPIAKARYHELRSGPYHILLRADRP